MKRASGISIHPRRKSFKKTKQQHKNYMEILSQELQTEIFARVASNSCTDILNCKKSCKLFKEIADDRYVYQHVCLDDFPIVSWHTTIPNQQHRQTFFNKCREFENPEINYRQAVVDYFSERRLESAYQCLQRAVNSGHIGALYVTGIALLFSRDEESKELGIRLLGQMKSSKLGRKKLRDCRKNLIKHLNMLWVESLIIEPRPVCCSEQDNHHRMRMGWDMNEYEDAIGCEACSADLEIKYICGDYSVSWM